MLGFSLAVYQFMTKWHKAVALWRDNCLAGKVKGPLSANSMIGKYRPRSGAIPRRPPQSLGHSYGTSPSHLLSYTTTTFFGLHYMLSMPPPLYTPVSPSPGFTHTHSSSTAASSTGSAANSVGYWGEQSECAWTVSACCGASSSFPRHTCTSFWIVIAGDKTSVYENL